MKSTAVSLFISVEFEAEEALKLFEVLDDNFDEFEDELAKIGADKIEYDGHFGPYVFYRIDVDNKRAQKIKKIEKILAKYLKIALE